MTSKPADVAKRLRADADSIRGEPTSIGSDLQTAALEYEAAAEIDRLTDALKDVVAKASLGAQVCDAEGRKGFADGFLLIATRAQNALTGGT